METPFQQVVIVDLASLGIGEAPEANRYDAVGADTLGHLATDQELLSLTTFEQWGLGNLRDVNPVADIAAADKPAGYFGRVHVAVPDWTAQTGIDELFQGSADAWFKQQTSSGLAVQVICTNSIHQFAHPVINASNDQAALDVALARTTAVSSGQQASQGITYVLLNEGTQHALHSRVTEYRQWLQDIDTKLFQLSHQLLSDTLLIVTSTQAIDPSFGRLTREYVPLFCFINDQNTGRALGIRRTLADVSATVEMNFHRQVASKGHSFLVELTSR
ncbi:hypothetical protein AYR62_01270 [Secundilactobacillus paracollinoides]|uniref:Phosphopentomutase n=2 Tax=Secundilactobacillus paracollinoides TaxID=240427 RepID=A0A1B2IV90_9LACO|nr:hypothetical protein [Secundilactobacillus paracollinoides]ANZ60182.1 hypothetical protein AYR61_01660 [Secundilactobacillus paracollinoides]ANZ62865.1 hypothetical protein AYR62_01270 [Secundilactobacillus paracollinoides]ANZ65976.1 hypothetical protein AYR63_01680 [Secundilactobacillus paracollinoides]KRL78449.1 phosphopentomutase [Secundilactobacillus paracollinoides DSM 15502 = JCM 11969]